MVLRQILSLMKIDENPKFYPTLLLTLLASFPRNQTRQSKLRVDSSRQGALCPPEENKDGKQ